MTDENPEDITDATVVDEPSTDLEVHVPSGEITAQIVSGSEPDEVIANATRIADSLTKLVQAQGFAVNVGGRKPHLEIGAWQALGALLGALGGQALHAETVWSRPSTEKTVYHVVEKRFGKVNGQRTVVSELEYDVEGYDWQACVEIKTAGGVVVGRAEGMCSRAESSWAKKPDPAVKAMSETRAASRAFRGALGWIVAIAGYNPTPAEEMPPEVVVAPSTPAPAGPPYGPPASPEQVVNARKAIGFLLGEEPDGNPVGWVLSEIEKAAVPSSGGEPYLPHFALSSVVRVASKVKARREATGPTSAPEPVSETAEPMVGDPSAETSDERVEREEAERLAAEHGDLS